MLVTVQSTELTWQSQDGQRKLYTVTVQNGSGGLQKVKTYSSAIGTAKVGQEFDVTSESKPGKFGTETFIKQVPSDNFSPANQQPLGNSRPSSPSGTQQFKADPEKQGSIERQAALKVAAEVVRDFYGTVGVAAPENLTLEQYSLDVAERGKYFASVVSGVDTTVAEVFPGAEVVDGAQKFDEALAAAPAAKTMEEVPFL